MAEITMAFVPIASSGRQDIPQPMSLLGFQVHTRNGFCDDDSKVMSHVQGAPRVRNA